MLFITVIYTHWLGQSAEPSPFVRSPEDKSNSSSENNKKKKDKREWPGSRALHQLYVHSFIHSFIHSFVRSFVRSFVYLPVRPPGSQSNPTTTRFLVVGRGVFVSFASTVLYLFFFEFGSKPEAQAGFCFILFPCGHMARPGCLLSAIPLSKFTFSLLQGFFFP